MGLRVGIDLGSGFIKAVLLEDKTLEASVIIPMAGGFQNLAEEALQSLLSKAGRRPEELDGIAVTGYGEHSLTMAQRRISPLSANARGINFFFPNVRTVIDIGTQQSSVIRLDDQGNMLDHVMSERCAAGSGWLLKVIARVLQLELEELGPLSLRSKKDINITTDCAVFAETEVISRISEGTPREDILHGIHRAMASKIANLAIKLGLDREVALIGGGAKDIGLVKCLKDTLQTELLIPPEPQLVTALGAVLS